MKGMGPERPMEAIVDEPEPGRVLTETYPATGGVTTFTVDAAPGGTSDVTFRTTWQPRGVTGLLERLAAPAFLRRVYKDELDQLQILAEARQNKSLSLTAVAEHLRIRPRHMEALESDRFIDLPGEVGGIVIGLFLALQLAPPLDQFGDGPRQAGRYVRTSAGGRVRHDGIRPRSGPE